MTWFDVDPGLRRRLIAGEAPALKVYLERVAREHGLRLHWTAKPEEWRQVGLDVYVPPPIDRRAAAIVAHELAHGILGRCPRTGDHLANISGRTLSCQSCENRATDLVCRQLLPPDKEIHRVLRSALGTYRRSTPAPVAAKREADRLMGTVTWAERFTAAKSFEDKLERQARANASVARDTAKRRRFNEMVARTERARRSL